MTDIDIFYNTIQKHNEIWHKKPVLRLAYREFYELIAANLRRDLNGTILEIGSGIGKINEVIPDCLCTDIFNNPQIAQVENAYDLSFQDSSISNLILFDVLHHLEFPGNAFDEFNRVLIPSGRLLIFEPAISILGLLVYGLAHSEPVGYIKEITWKTQSNGVNPDTLNYYASQGNATRIFFGKMSSLIQKDWKIVNKIKLSAISYVMGGGFSRLQLYPLSFHNFMRKIDKFCDRFPSIFATRMLIVLEKN
jgi:SAM-dependent methyltransferase